ncbi:metal ABC transporter permease [candidate division KSB1 bacterium]
MINAIEFMFLPFLACILLIGINIYFGIHVIKRDIIFINIAFGQIAAFGSSIASIVIEIDHGQEGHTHEENGLMAYLFSVLFITLAAGVFTFLKDNRSKMSLEALIGISYAISATGAVILLDKAAGGDVHVHEMLAGSILWVGIGDILKLGAVFVIIGLFHYVFRDKFIQLSDNYLNNDWEGKHKKLWDFLFFLSFGVVIIHAVEVGGILTVFAFLVIPASISLLFAESWMKRIIIGWCIGTIVSVFGLYLSWILDIPSGPTVILFLGVSLLVAVIFKVFMKKRIAA